MHNSKKILVGLAVVIALALGFVYGSNTHNAATMNIQVVKTYTVSPERGDEIKNVINNLFFEKDADGALGNAQSLGNGVILVRTSEANQHGISQLVSALANSKSNGRRAIQTDYWLVLGEDAKTSNSSEMGPLATVLGEIATSQGSQRFRILEHMSMRSLAGMTSEAKGTIVDTFKTTPNYVDNQITMAAVVRSKAGELKEFTEMKPDQFVVLGENYLTKGGRADDLLKSIGGENKSYNVYHIIRASLK